MGKTITIFYEIEVANSGLLYCHSFSQFTVYNLLPYVLNRGSGLLQIK